MADKNRRYWNLLANYLGRQKASMVSLALLLLVSTGLVLAAPQVLRYFIDAARRGEPTRVLLNAGLLFMGLAMLEQIIRLGTIYLTETIGWRATNALRLDLARHVLGLDLSFHNQHTPGEMIERIDGDVTNLANFFSQFVLQIIGNILILAGMMVLLWREHWLVGLSMTLLTALAMTGINALRVFSMPYWIAGRAVSAELSSFLEERLAGLEDIRTSGATGYKMRLLYALNRKLYEKYRAARGISNFITNGTFLLNTVSLAVGIGLGAYLYERGQLTLGSIFLISYYARLIGWPMREIVRELEYLQQAGASITRIDELGRETSSIRDGLGPALSSGPLEVAFEDVWFEYSPNSPVLEQVDFCLPAGKTLGLLGRTGSGKTTLARLLFRFYDPTQGTVRLGGRDIRQTPLTGLRTRIGLVTQEVQLFRGTIRENLTFFDRSIPDVEVLAAIEDLGLTGWLEQFPQGLDTLLMTGGGGLSAGEAQLLAFARVFLKNPGLIILDEASSRLDPATELWVEAAVERLIRNRTGILIAHRLGTIQRVDEILILEGGRILEHGPRLALAGNPQSAFARLLITGLEEALA